MPATTNGGRWVAALALMLVVTTAPAAAGRGSAFDAPFELGADDPRLDPAGLVATSFAKALPYPLGMAELEDGSILVATSDPVGGGLFASTGELVRLVDGDGDGIADGPGDVLAAGLPGALTAVRRAGRLVYAASAAPTGSTISVLRLGDTPSASLDLVGSIDIVYDRPMQHGTYGLAVQPDPVRPEGHRLYFNVGSGGNEAGGATVTLAGLAEGTAVDASIYRLAVDASGPAPVFSDLTLIATGLRNAAGIAFDPATGDLWCADNGIDTPGDPIVALSADELNVIRADDIGGEPEDFGYPSSYVDYATGETVGGEGVAPEVAFRPGDAGESEGANEIAVLPDGFPDPLAGAVVVGFHGQWDEVGLDNEENPLLAFQPATGEVITLVGNEEPAVGHLDGLLATDDALFVADLTGTGSLSGTAATGVIYRIAPGR